MTLKLSREQTTVTLSLLAFLLLISLVACRRTPDISGKWQEPEKTSSIEFSQDGTFTVIDDMGMSVSGRYTLLANAKIELEIRHPDSSVEIFVGNIEMQNDKLVLISGENNEVLIYEKINNETPK